MLDSTLMMLGAGGLSSLWNDVKTNWIGPLYFAAVAVFALVFLKQRAWRELIGFVAIAAIVGVFVFSGDTFLGKGSSGLSKTAAEVGSKIGK